eukprot:snap_masked-scaffold_11-processed-gene-11.23-mRNA-1 protein AED:1.00 eAED:1.00 QI:0/-1/0/0/-1/1/1/0/355
METLSRQIKKSNINFKDNEYTMEACFENNLFPTPFPVSKYPGIPLKFKTVAVYFKCRKIPERKMVELCAHLHKLLFLSRIELHGNIYPEGSVVKLVQLIIDERKWRKTHFVFGFDTLLSMSNQEFYSLKKLISLGKKRSSFSFQIINFKNLQPLANKILFLVKYRLITDFYPAIKKKYKKLILPSLLRHPIESTEFTLRTVFLNEDSISIDHKFLLISSLLKNPSSFVNLRDIDLGNIDLHKTKSKPLVYLIPSLLFSMNNFCLLKTTWLSNLNKDFSLILFVLSRFCFNEKKHLDQKISSRTDFYEIEFSKNIFEMMDSRHKFLFSYAINYGKTYFPFYKVSRLQRRGYNIKLY